MAYTKGKTRRTGHAGAKRGKGFWGVKKEAKKLSKKLDCQDGKAETLEQEIQQLSRELRVLELLKKRTKKQDDQVLSLKNKWAKLVNA